MGQLLTQLINRSKEPSTMAGLAVIALGAERLYAGDNLGWIGIVLGLAAVVFKERAS